MYHYQSYFSGGKDIFIYLFHSNHNGINETWLDKLNSCLHCESVIMRTMCIMKKRESTKESHETTLIQKNHGVNKLKKKHVHL